MVVNRVTFTKLFLLVAFAMFSIGSADTAPPYDGRAVAAVAEALNGL